MYAAAVCLLAVTAFYFLALVQMVRCPTKEFTGGVFTGGLRGVTGVTVQYGLFTGEFDLGDVRRWSLMAARTVACAQVVRGAWCHSRSRVLLYAVHSPHVYVL